MARSDETLWILLPGTAILLAMWVGLRSAGQRFWERTLDGPFIGSIYNGSITGSPASVLIIPSSGQLEVHQLQSHTNPVVLLRSPTGDIKWSRLFMPEKKFADDVSLDIKKRRLSEIIAKQTEHSLKRNQADIGKTFTVLVEGPSRKSQDFLQGRNSANKVVVFPKEDCVKGQYVRVRVEECTGATLMGKVVEFE